MAQIDFRKKINWHRRYRSPQGVKTEHEILRIFESDRGRIINSPAIRRLQQKTQVFPLERNAAVRTRLTHSMEVQQVGRYIAKEILSRLKELKLLEAYGLDELTGPFESIVEMSCLMHDIGNPPFGHFGEAAINDWFRQRLHPEDAESQPLTIAAAWRHYVYGTGKNRLTSCGARFVRTYVILRGMHKAFAWCIH